MNKLNRLLISVMLLTPLMLSASQLLGVISQDSVEVTETIIPTDSLGRSTPQGTVKGFFETLGTENYLVAAQFLDLSGFEGNADTARIITLVRKSELLLNEGGNVLPFGIINNTLTGNTGDGLAPELEKVGEISANGESASLYLELHRNENSPGIWLFSSETIAFLSRNATANKERYEEQLAADGVLTTRWKGGALRDWFTNIALALGAYGLAWLLTILIRWVVLKLRPNYTNSKYRRILRTLLVPFRLVLAVGLLLFLSRELGVSIIVRQAFGIVNLIAMWTALFIFIWLLIDALTTLGEEKLREAESYASLSAISFFRNTAKFVLIIVALLIIFSTIGVDLTAGLAALGVGGIALALGAQKTIENVIGGLSVVFDQPVSVGDFCKFGDTSGTVEKIGMRSTRIRTSARTVVTIPNSDFSSRMIENFSKRDLFLLNTKIGLRYETTSDQMRYVLVELRKLLYAHPKVDANPARVRFLGYGSDALEIEIYAYTLASDWNDFLGIQEDINLRMAKIIEDSGTGFAFPSQTIYLSRDSGISESKKASAEAKVREWIENDELQIPEFDPETIDTLKGKLDYPNKKGE